MSGHKGRQTASTSDKLKMWLDVRDAFDKHRSSQIDLDDINRGPSRLPREVSFQLAYLATPKNRAIHGTTLLLWTVSTTQRRCGL